MTLEEQLEAIEKAYFDDEEENKEAVLEALQGIHQSVLKASIAEAEPFKRALAKSCGGILIPYLFWFELLQFYDHKTNSDFIQELLKIFAASNFDDDEQRFLKPLIAIYFFHETEFQLDKFQTKVSLPAHPLVNQYFEQLMRFSQSNQSSIETYLEKIKLLRRYYPDFELFNKPINRLREELGHD